MALLLPLRLATSRFPVNGLHAMLRVLLSFARYGREPLASVHAGVMISVKGTSSTVRMPAADSSEPSELETTTVYEPPSDTFAFVTV